ncbi:helix-turn-helix domain-containing protein [Megasphaera sp. UBA4382]|uniref:helix-turn-helix domain-containing protein n=1 Tax=Megasphaera sp. UBA4382 TaxID=1946850 RepID=UPI0025BE7B4B|nr:helix-turn-helix domain-containing protein [Megasphaera sp. UBA4382]
MSSIGRVLQQEREQQGRTLKEVSDAVNIKEGYLDALEKEDFDVIPGAVFVKGFIRTYAEYLGLDGAGLVTAYKEEVLARKPRPEVRPVAQSPERAEREKRQKERNRQSKWQGITILSGIILFLLLIIWLLL